MFLVTIADQGVSKFTVHFHCLLLFLTFFMCYCLDLIPVWEKMPDL